MGMLTIAYIAAMFILLFAIPRFVAAFKEADAALPGITVLVAKASVMFRSRWWLVPLPLVAVIGVEAFLLQGLNSGGLRILLNAVNLFLAVGMVVVGMLSVLGALIKMMTDLTTGV